MREKKDREEREKTGEMEKREMGNAEKEDEEKKACKYRKIGVRGKRERKRERREI